MKAAKATSTSDFVRAAVVGGSSTLLSEMRRGERARIEADGEEQLEVVMAFSFNPKSIKAFESKLT